MKKPTQSRTRVRVKLALRGVVQGVGFRPFVHRLANELAVTGWVNNSPQGVFVEAESPRPTLEQFVRRLEAEKPPRSFIQAMETTWHDPVGFERFEIRPSENDGEKIALVLPDIATCPDCLREIGDPANRRYRYPFTNCTHCGPRFSLINALPYDRLNTSMDKFVMCPTCRAEYKNPSDRRFHAQPNACPICGPQLEFWNADGEAVFGGNDALRAATNAIRRGKIVAVKGVGGFHLLADARDENVVQRLRVRKGREEKPLALMFPSLQDVKRVCEVSILEERWLTSPEAPIVLLKKIGSRQLEIANAVAPNNPNLGAMLPSNPLYHLIMAEIKFPVVATSGNLSDEPLCTDELEARERLRGIADAFLVHNRPIVRPEDDSIVRVVLDREMMLRRARGFAPLPIILKSKTGERKPEIILAVGAHLKNTLALIVGENIFISQHLGDLETEQANEAFRRACVDLPKLYGVTSAHIVADLHPDYLSTKYAQECDQKVTGVQHHVAHVLSCVAENEVELPALGVAWDGTGYGTDGTIWGGEFFHIKKNKIQRVAHLRTFRLPGGDKAVKEPRRAALGLLYELYGEAAFEMCHLPPLRQMPPIETVTLKGMLQRQINSPSTSSMGRLFDAVASLVDLRHRMGFEGQPAMELEFAVGEVETNECYDLPLVNNSAPLILDWSRMIHDILADVNGDVSVANISAKFHNTLAEAVVVVARRFAEPRVILSGGCFQNSYLLERTVKRLRAEKFQPYWQQCVPTNDGGIALGQIYAVRSGLTLT